MFKKVFLSLIIIILNLLTVSAAFGVNRSDLNLEFFSRFNDECLDYYIYAALENNHDASQASSRVEQYRQQAKISLGKELPSFSVAANYLGIHVPMLDNFTLSKNAFILPFFMNYEADFFLKNRDKTRSAKKAYEASQYEEKAVYLSLLSDVATVYTNILEYDELIKIQESNVVIYSKLLDYNSKKFLRGLISTTEMNDSQKNLETAKNELENMYKQRAILIMQLAVLTGKKPDQDLQRGKLQDFDYNGNIPDEISSDVIFSRPDVMQVEKLLEKSCIDIRVARKEFLPNFNILGIWAFNTIAPGTFFSWESSLAAIMAGATQDIFKGGQKIANLRLQKLKYEELFEKYRQTDLEAVKEVNTALCFIKHDTLVENNTLKKLNYEYYNLENLRKKLARGTVSNPDYLQEKINLAQSQKDAVEAKNQRLINYYTLYKAVGGKL